MRVGLSAVFGLWNHRTESVFIILCEFIGNLNDFSTSFTQVHNCGQKTCLENYVKAEVL